MIQKTLNDFKHTEEEFGSHITKQGRHGRSVSWLNIHDWCMTNGCFEFIRELKEEIPQDGTKGPFLIASWIMSLQEEIKELKQEQGELNMLEKLRWKKYPVLNDGFITLVDVMGDDAAIVQAARVSYGQDKREEALDNPPQPIGRVSQKDRNLIRYMMSHNHTTPFEMVEFKFLVRVPMDCWRQWIRHRTASVNEYSTRYTEAIDSQQTTDPAEWRLQSDSNKQGSGKYLVPLGNSTGIAENLCREELDLLKHSKEVYKHRLDCGIAKEQARKDLPLSTYTEAYWKCDLHNIFGFLRQRMDSHAQLEIRSYANAMAEIVKQVVPVAWEAFEDYQLQGCRMSRMEMEHIRKTYTKCYVERANIPEGMTDREWLEFNKKLTVLI